MLFPFVCVLNVLSDNQYKLNTMSFVCIFRIHVNPAIDFLLKNGFSLHIK